MRDASRARVVERQPSSGRRKLRQAVALDLGHAESLTGRGEGQLVGFSPTSGSPSASDPSLFRAVSLGGHSRCNRDGCSRLSTSGSQLTICKHRR
jgi:hypothetical protein